MSNNGSSSINNTTTTVTSINAIKEGKTMNTLPNFYQPVDPEDYTVEHGTVLYNVRVSNSSELADEPDRSVDYYKNMNGAICRLDRESQLHPDAEYSIAVVCVNSKATRIIDYFAVLKVFDAASCKDIVALNKSNSLKDNDSSSIYCLLPKDSSPWSYRELHDNLEDAIVEWYQETQIDKNHKPFECDILHFESLASGEQKETHLSADSIRRWMKTWENKMILSNDPDVHMGPSGNIWFNIEKFAPEGSWESYRLRDTFDSYARRLNNALAKYEKKYLKLLAGNGDKFQLMQCYKDEINACNEIMDAMQDTIAHHVKMNGVKIPNAFRKYARGYITGCRHSIEMHEKIEARRTLRDKLDRCMKTHGRGWREATLERYLSTDRAGH